MKETVTNNRKRMRRHRGGSKASGAVDTGVNFTPPAEIAEDYEKARKTIGESRRGMAIFVTCYAIPRVLNGTLVRLGDRLVDAVGGVPIMEHAVGEEVAKAS